jgi:hypothetical protein
MPVTFERVGPFLNNAPPPINDAALNNVEQGILNLVAEINSAVATLATATAKLAGIQEGATANETDAYLLSLGNATGTLAMSKVSGLVDTLNSKHTDIANTKVAHVFVYSDVNVARPTTSTGVMIWWQAATAGLDVPVNALDFDRVDLLGA